MQVVKQETAIKHPIPAGVTSIEDVRQIKRPNRTLSKAVSLHLEGKLESAAKLLSKAIESGERDPALFSALGHIHFEMRDYASAAATYTQLVELEPRHRTAHFNLGGCPGNLKQGKRATVSFRDAAEADGTRADALLGLGISLIHTGEPAQALEPLDKYLSLFPEHEQALFGKAVALQQTGRHAEAVEQYRKVLARNPRCEEALSNLVAMFLEKKDHESVRRYAEMLVELQPESTVAIEALATLAFADGDFLAAARHCRGLSEIAPDRFENWFNLGVAYHKLGNQIGRAHV